VSDFVRSAAFEGDQFESIGSGEEVNVLLSAKKSDLVGFGRIGKICRFGFGIRQRLCVGVIRENL